MRSSSFLRAAALVVSLTVFASACSDETDAAGVGARATAVPVGGVQALVRQQPTAADGSITFVVRVVSNGVTVSSYQGKVSFAPGAFELVSVTPRSGSSNEAHVLNPGEFAGGTLRFAGLTTTKFEGTDDSEGIEAFRFVVRPLSGATQAGLKVTLDVVGTDVGAAIAKEKLFASPVLENASGRRLR